MVVGMKLRRRAARLAVWGAMVLAALLPAALVAACSSGQSAQEVGQAYLTAWESRDWSAMRALVASPPADFTSVNAAVLTELGAQQATFDPGRISITGNSASEPVTEHITIAGVGTIQWKTRLRLTNAAG